MGLADVFPTVDAFLRWGQRQHEAGQLSAEQLVTMAIERYASSPQLLEAFIREAFYFFALEAVTGRRPSLEPDGDAPAVVRTEYPVEKIERMKMTAQRRARIMQLAHEHEDNPVAKFFEKHPTHGVTVPLLMMTREELLAAANQRDVESIEARRRAELCRSMAERLEPGQIAEEVFTEGEVERLAKLVMQRVRVTPKGEAKTA